MPKLEDTKPKKSDIRTFFSKRTGLVRRKSAKANAKTKDDTIKELKAKLAQKSTPPALNLNSSGTAGERERERESSIETEWLDTPTPSAEKAFDFSTSEDEQTTDQELDKPNKSVNLTTFAEKASQTEPFNLQLPEITRKNQQIQQKDQQISQLEKQLTNNEISQQKLNDNWQEADEIINAKNNWIGRYCRIIDQINWEKANCQAQLTEHNQQFNLLRAEYDYLQETSQWELKQYECWCQWVNQTNRALEREISRLRGLRDNEENALSLSLSPRSKNIYQRRKRSMFNPVKKVLGTYELEKELEGAKRAYDQLWEQWDQQSQELIKESEKNRQFKGELKKQKRRHKTLTKNLAKQKKAVSAKQGVITTFQQQKREQNEQIEILRAQEQSSQQQIHNLQSQSNQTQRDFQSEQITHEATLYTLNCICQQRDNYRTEKELWKQQYQISQNQQQFTQQSLSKEKFLREKAEKELAHNKTKFNQTKKQARKWKDKYLTSQEALTRRQQSKRIWKQRAKENKRKFKQWTTAYQELRQQLITERQNYQQIQQERDYWKNQAQQAGNQTNSPPRFAPAPACSLANEQRQNQEQNQQSPVQTTTNQNTHSDNQSEQQIIQQINQSCSLGLSNPSLGEVIIRIQELISKPPSSFSGGSFSSVAPVANKVIEKELQEANQTILYLEQRLKEQTPFGEDLSKIKEIDLKDLVKELGIQLSREAVEAIQQATSYQQLSQVRNKEIKKYLKQNLSNSVVVQPTKRELVKPPSQERIVLVGLLLSALLVIGGLAVKLNIRYKKKR